jgi:glycine/D-amino acid oxidase-like deaminating enzyme
MSNRERSVARPPDYDVAVLGAGIVGASAAWHLARRGMRVVVIDASGPAAAASGASDGAVSVASKKPGVMARLANRSLAYTRRLAEAGGPLRGVFGDRPSYYLATSPAEEQALGDLVA